MCVCVPLCIWFVSLFFLALFHTCEWTGDSYCAMNKLHADKCLLLCHSSVNRCIYYYLRSTLEFFQMCVCVHVYPLSTCPGSYALEDIALPRGIDALLLGISWFSCEKQTKIKSTNRSYIALFPGHSQILFSRQFFSMAAR